MDLVDLSSQINCILEGKVNKLNHLIDRYKTNKTYSPEFDQIIITLYVAKINKLTLLATELIDKILQETDFTLFEETAIKGLKADFLLMRGNDKKALSLIDDLNQVTTTLPHDLIPLIGDIHVFVRLLKAKYYKNINEINLANNYVNETSYLLKDNSSIFTRFELIQIRTYIFQESGEYEKAILCISEFIDSIPASNQFLKFKGYIEKANIIVNNGNHEDATEVIKQAEQFISENPPHILMWDLNNIKAKAFLYQGNLDQAKAYDEKNLEIAMEINSTYLLATSYNNLGAISKTLGDMEFGLEYLFLSLDMNEELGDKRQIGTTYNNIGLNYMMKGELDRALEFLNLFREIVEESGNDSSKAVAYVNLGQIYHMKGNYEYAKKYYKLCQVIDEKYNNEYNLSEVIYDLLTLHIEQGEIEEAKTYLKKLEDILNNSENKIIEMRYRIGEVQILKSSKRSINKAKAQENLMKIVDEDPVDFELYVAALLNLCDLLLVELKQTGEDEVLEEIKGYVEKLHKYATVQDAYYYLAESYLIKSKIAQLELDMEQAKSYIEMAETVSLDKGMDKLAQNISTYYDQLLDKMKTMELLYDNDASIKQRLEVVDLEEVLIQLISTRSDDIVLEQEVPIMILINQQGGGNLYKRIFDEHSGLNEELIAGLFSALHTLSDEIFNTQKSTQRIKHEDYTIVMKSVQDKFLFCYVFRGQSYGALKKLDRLVKSIVDSSTIWDILNREINHLTKLEKEGMDLIVNTIISTEIQEI